LRAPRPAQNCNRPMARSALDIIGGKAMNDVLGFILLFLLFPVVIVLNGHAYTRIRSLGYFPPTAVNLVLGVDAVTLLAVMGVIALLLPRIEVWWEVLITYIGILMFAVMSVAFGCAVLVRKLPKIRDSTRVFGPRRVSSSLQRTSISLGCLTIAGGIMALQMSGAFFFVLGIWLFGLGIVVCFMIFASRFRMFHKVTIEDAIKSDPRLLVLYLRPFLAEWTLFAVEEGEPGSDDAAVSMMFDYYLGDAFRERIGPFGALGSPEDYLPPHHKGAVRTYADDGGWYEYFERLAGRAGCIVMLVSDSDNLQRELRFVRREGLQRRLFIFTPKDSKDYSRGPLAWIMSRL